MLPAADRPSRERIGPYRFVARVGAGGMGEVFRAWDPRLEREVAVKVLHPDAAGDADRQRQLLAEGRAASALNHPNILRVYDADIDGTSYYLVSEWLEGKSLREELARGPLPVKRLLDLAVQIADGLAAAHAMGIVHRDIKPENVMLARDGTARIVDFGLSRGSHAPSQAQAVVQPSTVSLDGGVSGTPAYMSPEQARGQLGDFRSDQFSFGALLYEMATGRPAFRRDGLAATLSAVLHDEPEPIAAISPRVPAAVTWIVEQCLAKEAGERYAATEDLTRELRRTRERLREAAAEPRLDMPPEGRRWKPAGVGVGSGIATAAIGLALASTAPAPGNLRFTPIASAAVYEGMPDWSPDGQSLAWVADVDGVLQVFVRRLTDAVATQVTRGRFDAEEPMWFRDGRGLYFISAAGDRTGLWSVGSAGGRPELVLDNVNHAALHPSGRQLAMLRNDSKSNQQLWWAAADGSSSRMETRPPFDAPRFGIGGQLRFSPDGSQLLTWVFNGAPSPASFFYLLPVASNQQAREVFHGIRRTANLPPFSWLPDNRHVLLGRVDADDGARHLWIADTRSPALRRVTATHTAETWPAVSPDGKSIAYSSEEVDFDLIGIAVDGGSQRKVLATARNELAPTWSPAGDQYAFVTDRTGTTEIWVRSRDSQWERPLVTARDFAGPRTATLGSLAFAPDGRTLAYQRRGAAGALIWLTPTAGGTPVQMLDDNRYFSVQDSPAWSPDSEWLAFTYSRGPSFGLGKVRVGTKEFVTVLDGLRLFSKTAWSPDGRWLAAETLDGLVRVSPDGGTPELLTSDVAFEFAWLPDSRRLAALVEAETVGHVALIEIDTDTRESRVLNPDLGPVPIANQPIRGLSFAPGQGFLTSLASARSDIWLLEGLEMPGHWMSRWFKR